MTADERALIAALIAAPADDTPRLVYADWLEEHDRPGPAAVRRTKHHPAGGSVTGHLHFATNFPDLWPQLAYLPGATSDLRSALRRGIIFLMAWWSGPARQAFASLATALRVSDPGGELTVAVADMDGITEGFASEFDRLAREYDVYLGGNGEALWVCRDRVSGVTHVGTPVHELNRKVRALLAARSSDDPP